MSPVNLRQIAESLIEGSVRRVAGYRLFSFWADNGQFESYPAVPVKSDFRQLRPGRRSFSKPRFTG
jgi:hypothetical protein